MFTVNGQPVGPDGNVYVEGSADVSAVEKQARIGDAWWTTALAAPAETPMMTVTTKQLGGALTRPRIVDNVLDQENDPTFRYGGAPKAVRQGTTADIVVADRIDPDLATVFVLRPRVIVAGAADVEFCLRPSATSVKLRLVVDGKWLPITTLDGLTAHTDHYVRFQFPTARAREIELQIPYSNIAFGGAATSSSGTLIRPRAKKGPKVAFLGDSFTGGAGAVTSIETHAGYAARLLGAGDWRNYGIGGSGYVTSQVFADRVESIVAWKPDIVVILGSRNDGSAYSATVRAAAVSVIDALQDVPLVVVSGPSQAGLEGMRDTVRDAAIIAGRPFVDTLGVITPALTDNVHPTVEGHRALARVLYDGVRKLWVSASPRPRSSPRRPIRTLTRSPRPIRS